MLETKQQALELIFPGEQPLDGAKALGEDSRIEQRLASSLGLLSSARIWVDVGHHAAVENGFAVRRTIVHAIEAHDGAAQV